jgi:hypothetical protein
VVDATPLRERLDEVERLDRRVHEAVLAHIRARTVREAALMKRRDLIDAHKRIAGAPGD